MLHATFGKEDDTQAGPVQDKLVLVVTRSPGPDHASQCRTADVPAEQVIEQPIHRRRLAAVAVSAQFVFRIRSGDPGCRSELLEIESPIASLRLIAPLPETSSQTRERISGNPHDTHS